MRLNDLVQTSRRVAQTSGRLAKIELLAALLKRAAPAEIETAIAFLSGAPRQGRIGVGYASLEAARAEPAAEAATLEVVQADAALERLARTTGKGSAQEKNRLLRDLFARATQDEQEFLFRLLIGELRQGALEGLVTEAVSRAAGLEADVVRRAAMLAGDLVAVARAALTEGAAGLARYQVELFRPIQPMLAQAASDVADALTQLGEAAFEYKLDGARIQVHKAGDEVRVFSRQLNDVTVAAPEVVAAVRRLPVRETILDGEGIALRSGGEAGARGAAWLKVKPAQTLDLVVLAAEWGHGRRRGRLSNLHLGARDPETGRFVMLGKTFKGMTDEMLGWQTEQLLQLEVGREGH